MRFFKKFKEPPNSDTNLLWPPCQWNAWWPLEYAPGFWPPSIIDDQKWLDIHPTVEGCQRVLDPTTENCSETGKQQSLIIDWSWGLCCPLEYAPGFSTWINCSCGPQIGISKLASLSCCGRREERRRDFRGTRDLLLRWLILLLFQHGSCFSPASFNRLGSRAQLLPPPFFSAFFPCYLFIF
jgi:hypothetical protein